jgi:carboxyl-terminal processing protease
MKLKRTVLGPVLVAGVAFLSGGWLLQRGPTTPAEGVDPRVFGEVLSRVSHDYVDEHSQEELYKMAVEGMLYELGDPHTTFMTAAEYSDLRTQTTGEYGGVGMQIAEKSGWVTVLAPLPGTPAERAGIRAGDRIVEVEGESTAGWTDDEAVKRLRGPKGEPVHIKVARPGVDDPIPFTIVRDEIHINSVTSAYMVEPGVGLIRLSIFAETSTDEIRKAIAQLREQGMKGLILDLRTNPGGLLDQGVSVSNLFLEPGQPIVETRGREPGETERFVARQPESVPEEMPVVVLVDEYTASAAEIVSGALQDHDRALVLGLPTFGKGSVQTLFPLSGGNFLKMTTGRWYTPSGRSIQKDHKRQGDPAALLEDDPMGEDSSAAADTAKRQAYRTDSGRIVYGGGGIVPDLIVRPDTLTTAAKEFVAAASKGGNKFSDTAYRYAIEYVRAHPSLPRDFTVTPAMMDAFYSRLGQAGVEVTRQQYDAASSLVRSRLEYEIAFAKFGSTAASERLNEEDNLVRTAVELLHRSPTRQALFQAAEARRQASR